MFQSTTIKARLRLQPFSSRIRVLHYCLVFSKRYALIFHQLKRKVSILVLYRVPHIFWCILLLIPSPVEAIDADL